MVISGSVLGPEPAGWPVKDLRVNKIAQDRFKAKADVDAYVMTEKPTKIVYDVWNPFDTRGVGNMGGNESLYSLDRIERLETLRQLGLPIPDTVAPGEEDIYITSVLSDYGVGSLEQWLNMTAKQRKETIDEANKRGRESRATSRGKPFTTPPMDDTPFFEIQQGFQNLSDVLQDQSRAYNNLLGLANNQLGRVFDDDSSSDTEFSDAVVNAFQRGLPSTPRNPARRRLAFGIGRVNTPNRNHVRNAVTQPQPRRVTMEGEPVTTTPVNFNSVKRFNAFTAAGLL